MINQPAKHWILKPKLPAAALEKFPEIDPILLQLLYARGLSEQSAIDVFLEPDYSRDVHDPFAFRQMAIAVERIMAALKKQERIVIYGDYDADGVCASAVMTETLRALGGVVDVYIPYRETEGYGMNLPAVDEIAKQGTKLIITVDCGTTNVAEVDRARTFGIETIITDHHDEPPQLPAALALLNPELPSETYPFKHLAASGVAFKLASALLQASEHGKTLGRDPLPTGWEKWLLDLVAISTVTDMVPLLGENRVFVRFGLAVLQKGRRVGVRELFNTMRSDIASADEETLGFQVGPRLNAAGRMNHASTAYRLLTTSDVTEARRLAEQLSTANAERQRVTELTFQQALQQIIPQVDERLLYAVGSDWSAGILGLVASKVSERFHRPAVMMTVSQGKIIGSGRSIESFDITAALRDLGHYFDRFGGHPQACGFTVKPGIDPREVGRALQARATAVMRDDDLQPILLIDAEVVLDDLKWELIEEVERLAPFGMDAERPRFLSRGLQVVAVDTVGKDHQHLRMHVRHATSTARKTIGFRFGALIERLRPGDKIDLVFEVGVNEWNGQREIELKIIDLQPAR